MMVPALAGRFLDLMFWWCEMFGITDWQSVSTASAIVAAGIFLGILNIVVGAVVGALLGLIR